MHLFHQRFDRAVPLNTEVEVNNSAASREHADQPEPAVHRVVNTNSHRGVDEGAEADAGEDEGDDTCNQTIVRISW